MSLFLYYWVISFFFFFCSFSLLSPSEVLVHACCQYSRAKKEWLERPVCDCSTLETFLWNQQTRELLTAQNSLKMLSRLSGLATTVLQELSGEDGDAVTEPSIAVETLQSESMEEAPEELLERLAQTEKLVVQLKDLIREKDALLQEKETVLKKEREAADAKLMKLKLQAKAKLASLNKRIEELTQKESPLSTQALADELEYPKKNENKSEGHREEVEVLKEQLREQEETVQDLKKQLDVAKVNLKDAEIKYATQLSSLQEMIQEKEALLEERVHQHQAELLKMVVQSDMEVEMQQNLRTLQRKLEEQEAALLGRTQMVELLQQELHAAEKQNQTLLDQCQKMEVELSSMRDVLDAERHGAQDLREELELELAERKLSSHRLQEEVQHLSEELEKARRAQAELEVKYKDLEQEHRLEVEEKQRLLGCVAVAEQELPCGRAVLGAEEEQLHHHLGQPLVPSVACGATARGPLDELLQKPEEVVCCQDDLKSQPQVQLSELEQQDESTSQEKIVDQEDQNETSFLPTENLERQKTEEIPHLQPFLQESQQEAVMLAEDAEQIRELENLQQQYILVGVEAAENSRLKAQLQQWQQEADKQLRLQEQLEQEGAVHQQELQQLRQEKTTWEKQSNSMKEQYLMAIAEKDKQLSHLQRITQEMKLPFSKSQTIEEQHQSKISPEVVKGDFSSLETEMKHLQAQLNDSLKELHQKELRIQQLNSKLSQVFEEKNALSLQLRGSSRSVCESHQHYSEVLSRCLVLERQLQELQAADKSMELFVTDAAPGAPQEKNEPQRGTYTPELQELQLRLSETEQLHSSTRQDMKYLEEQLEEERERRLAAEEALCAAQDQIGRLQSNEWASSLSASIDMIPGHEQSLLIDSTDNNSSRTRSALGLRRLLRSLFRSRTHLPLLAATYLLAVHVLLLLCFTGHL
uniref:Golgin B1 n=1 Tax=Ficedula albicollis TaxID=59894 RepID=A0A803W7C6_FICAL